MTEKIPVKNSVAPGTKELVKPLDAPPRLSEKKTGKYTFYPGDVLRFHHFPSKGCKGDFVVTRTMLDSPRDFFVPKSRCVMDSNGLAFDFVHVNASQLT